MYIETGRIERRIERHSGMKKIKERAELKEIKVGSYICLAGAGRDMC